MSASFVLVSAILLGICAFMEALNTDTRYRMRQGLGIVTEDGAVYTIGNFTVNKASPEIEAQLMSGVVSLIASDAAYAALKDDGSVVAWGDVYRGGKPDEETRNKLKSGVIDLFSLYSGFLAIKNDTSVVAWGYNPGGLTINAGDVEAIFGIKEVFTTHGAVAALRYDGTVFVSGDKNYGAYIPWYIERRLKNIESISSTFSAFAAITTDGRVVTWGGSFSDKGSSDNHWECSSCGADDSKVRDRLFNVKQVYASQGAFCALTYKGEAICWGEEYFGGNPTGGYNMWNKRKQEDMRNIRMIYSNDQTFCAVKKDDTGFCWGGNGTRGNLGETRAHGANTTGVDMTNIKEIFTTDEAFAALKRDGSVQVWGAAEFGGRMPVDERASLAASGVISAVAVHSAFMFLREDGTIFPVGYNGETNEEIMWVHELSPRNIRVLYSSLCAFAAVDKDGKLNTLGPAVCGGTPIPIPPFNDDPHPAIAERNKQLIDKINNEKRIRVVVGNSVTFADSSARTLYQCPPRTYGDGYPHCTPCPTLPIGSANSDKISKWGPGIRSTISSCLQCDEGKYTSDGLICNSECVSDYTYQTDTFFGVPRAGCYQCEFAGHEYNATSKICEKCPAGKHDTGTGCEICPRGKFAPSGGMSKCHSCQPGYTTKNDSAGLSFNECYKMCKPGEYSDPDDANHNQGCYACSKGKYAPYSNSWQCMPCPTGSIAKDEGSSQCQSCPAGKFQKKGEKTACFDCGVDEFQDRIGASECKACPEGEGTNSQTRQSKCSLKELYEGCDSGYRRAEGGGRCIICEKGKYSIRQGTDDPVCFPCQAGSYAELEGMSSCTPCPKGRYSRVVGSEFANDCLFCSAGKYNSKSGSSECAFCPAGTECPIKELQEFSECPSGSVARRKGSTNCTICPTGRYQSSSGEAVCDDCSIGKYNPKNGSIGQQDCVGCPVGTFAAYEGAAECTLCDRTSIAPIENSTECQPCEGVGIVANPERTKCEFDAALKSKSLLETMYTKGGALYGAFIITVVVLAIVGFIQYKKEQAYLKDPDNCQTGQLGRLQVLVKAGLPGFSFATEAFLICGLIWDAPALGATMLLFRLLHFLVGAMFAAAIIGNIKAAKTLERYGIVRKATGFHDLIDEKFAVANMPLVGAITLLSLTDCTLLIFYPWKNSRLFKESRGFPSIVMMRWLMLTKVVHSLVSVICQFVYLGTDSGLDAPTTTSQAKALFGMNITISTLGVVMSLVMLCLKDGLLSRITKEEERRKKEEEKTKNDRLRKSEVEENVTDRANVASDKEKDEDQNQDLSSGLRLEILYPAKEPQGIISNPMLLTNTTATPSTSSVSDSIPSSDASAGTGVGAGGDKSTFSFSSSISGLADTANTDLAALKEAEKEVGRGAKGPTQMHALSMTHIMNSKKKKDKDKEEGKEREKGGEIAVIDKAL